MQTYLLNENGVRSFLQDLKNIKSKETTCQIFQKAKNDEGKEEEIAISGRIKSLSELERELINLKHTSKTDLLVRVYTSSRSNKSQDFHLRSEKTETMQGLPQKNDFEAKLDTELQKIKLEFEITSLKQENENLKEKNTQLQETIKEYEKSIDELEAQIRPLQRQANFADKIMLGVQNALPMIAQQPKVVEVLSGLLPQEQENGNEQENELTEEEEMLLDTAKRLQEQAGEKTRVIFEIAFELAKKQDKIGQILEILNA
ncbi:DUF3450 domain-containing protein [Raineya orbicola]|uniref:Uncharacterized protein n=1 Tax=Raineya orbicola TaxID=2016530 RepID=A0A2N3I819_9BACT|nr:hypothetical protein [Raineya orbicola]PKQ66438.1 hypothetical protein Rain11_2389 [Raineya orbicola]